LGRTRAGLWLILACIAFFALVDLGIPADRFGPAYTIKAGHAAFTLGLLAVLRWRPTPAVTWWAALFAVNATYGFFALGDLVKGHEATAPLLAITCSMAAAALLPWGLTAQAATAVVTSVGNVVVQRLAGSTWEAMVDPAASVIAAQGVAVYVTLELERFRTERRRAESDLARANLVKTEFVSTMSHELRTPLNVIMGYTEMLDDPAYAEPAYALGRIRQANTELLELIEATLDLNRLETGRDDPVFGEVAIPELWSELAAEFAPSAHRAGLRVEWATHDCGPLRTDRRKLKTVVKNLVGNALKFTTDGWVRVHATEADGHCVITVRDSGIGIAPNALPHIFDMFRQADSSDRRSYGGVGLGLHIVQRLCRQLGADVAVASRPGRGTTFTVRIPMAPRVVCAA
jgi:signal transduction histidine kinase